PWSPRASSWSSTGRPKTVEPADAWRLSTPIRKDCERSPRRPANSVAASERVPLLVSTLARRTQPDGAVSAATARTPLRPSRAPRRAAVSTSGCQRWYGEIRSYGSATERRYGTGRAPGQASAAAAVRPPELEEKNVCATAPRQVRIWPAVRATASSLDARSALMPRYIWLRWSG